MKVIQEGKRWWAGLLGQCQSCAMVVEFEGDPKEMLILHSGDFKDPAVYRWRCPSCSVDNMVTLDRLRSEQPMIARLLDSKPSHT